MESVKLTGKTVIVTGANCGIGKENAVELARRGARVILACRNAERGEEARREIVERTGNSNVVVQLLDLASLNSVKTFADEFNKNEARLDILVNNAGLVCPQRQETEDHFELEFGVNHLGHFYLTYLLLDKLKGSAPSRIVIVSSKSHEYDKLDFDDLQFKRNWSPMSAYGRSKTANILHAVHLAKLLQGTGVTTYALHPGMVRTEIIKRSNQGCLFSCAACLQSCFRCCIMDSAEGSATNNYCCLEPSISEHSGRYYSDSRESPAKRRATDPELALKLWNISAELCHVTP